MRTFMQYGWPLGISVAILALLAVLVGALWAVAKLSRVALELALIAREINAGMAVLTELLAQDRKQQQVSAERQP
jgi:hypothetical protein